MKVKIHNSVTSVVVSCKRSDFVAKLKALYTDSEGFVGSQTPVELVFRGQMLDDLKQLKDYGLEDGAVLAHVGSPASRSQPQSGNNNNVEPTPPVNYARIATLLEEAHKASLGGRPDPSDYVAAGGQGQDWVPHWTRGAEWEAFPPVLVGSTGLPREDVLEEGGAGRMDEEEEEETEARRFEEVLRRMHGPEGLEEPERGATAGNGAGPARKQRAISNGAADGGDLSVATDRGSSESEEEQHRHRGGRATNGEGHHPASSTNATGGTTTTGAAAQPSSSSSSAAPSFSTGGVMMTATDLQRENDRALLRAMMARLRTARRSRQALVPRGTDRIVHFEEARDRKIHIPPPTRIFRNLYIAQVGRFAFRLMHRIEGRWSGEAEVHIPGHVMSLPDVRAVSVSLNFDDASGCWRERQSLTTPDGLVSSQYIILRPVGDGACRIELSDEYGRILPTGMSQGQAGPSGEPAAVPNSHHAAASHGGAAHGNRSPPRPAPASAPTSGTASAGSPAPSAHGHSSGGWGGLAPPPSAALGYDMTLQEQGDNMLVLVATSRATGKTVLVETITVISDMARVRAVQRFGEDGAFQVMCLIREQRVLDSVTAAVDRYPRNYRA